MIGCDGYPVLFRVSFFRNGDAHAVCNPVPSFMYCAGEEWQFCLSVSFKEPCLILNATKVDIDIPAAATLAQHLFRVNNTYHYTIC